MRVQVVRQQRARQRGLGMQDAVGHGLAVDHAHDGHQRARRARPQPQGRRLAHRKRAAAGYALADLGAELIKVESPAGDAARAVGWTRDAFGPMSTVYNRGKRSVVLDLRQPVAREQAQQLACSADVVLQNARPGAMDKQGLGAQRRMALVPRLVYGQVSGFGRHGPANRRTGLEIAAQAERVARGSTSRWPMRR